jgi:1,4-alpha-glucan branching enzyme
LADGAYQTIPLADETERRITRGKMNWEIERPFLLSNCRYDEKTLGWTESHDQALVGDQTLIFRLVGDRIHIHILVSSEDMVVSRSIALQKMRMQ